MFPNKGSNEKLDFVEQIHQMNMSGGFASSQLDRFSSQEVKQFLKKDTDKHYKKLSKILN